MTLPRVLIADDHQLFAEGLAQLLKGSAQVVGSIRDGSQLSDAVRRLNPDVVLLDVSMPTVSGLEALRRLREEGHDCKVIVLTMHRDVQLVLEALKSGALGFVLKESSGDELLTAIVVVLQGHSYVPSALRHVLAMRSDPIEPGSITLTSQQRDILRLLVQGARIKEIAGVLDISAFSVESLKYQIMQELNVHSTAELVRYVLEHDLVALT